MNILVTGASRGVGKEVAKILSGSKENIIFLLSRNETKLQMLKKECKKRNECAKIVLVPLNINILSDEISLLEILKKHIEKLDVVINNAGYLIRKAFEETTSEEVQQIFNTNFLNAAMLIRQLLPLLKKSDHAHVVNIGSMAGVQGSAKFSGLSYYSASKAALATLTECLAEEYKQYAVSFNCLAFGSVQTEMFSEAFPGLKAPINASEMAKLVADFALQGHTYFNGKILPVSLSTP